MSFLSSRAFATWASLLTTRGPFRISESRVITVGDEVVDVDVDVVATVTATMRDEI